MFSDTMTTTMSLAGNKELPAGPVDELISFFRLKSNGSWHCQLFVL